MNQRASAATRADPPDARPHRARLAAAGFGLNLAWEVGHWPLYECRWSPLTLTRAAAVDAALTVAMAETAGRSSTRGKSLVLGTGLGGIALAIELIALRRGRRLYAPTMPTVAGVGLSPLIQLPLLGLLAVRISGAGTGRRDFRGGPGPDPGKLRSRRWWITLVRYADVGNQKRRQ